LARNEQARILIPQKTRVVERGLGEASACPRAVDSRVAMSRKILGTEETVAAVPGMEPAPALAPSRGHAAFPDEQGAVSTPVGSTPARHVFAARYEILGLVGSGGMGTVYRAHDRELDEVVALKLLRHDVLDHPGMLDRFRQEVKLARRVTHRNVARTYDIGESEGEKFLTMEFIEGEPLAARVAREGALTLDLVAGVAEGICAGLGAAHAAGVVHRDLKPDNVLLARDGRVVLTDFGIARAFSGAGVAVTMGIALGTPAYMSPEQVEGASDLDARADIYALGAMLYECLTGERAWNGASVWAIASARLLQPPPDPRALRPDVPAAAAELVLRCMARKRDDRFASAEDVARVLASMTMPAPKARPSAQPPPPPQGIAEGDAKAVAVLRFRNLGEPGDDYVAEALADDLVDALSMTPGLRVMARGAVDRLRGETRDAREIGRELRVHVVVDGSVRRAGGMLRVTARVVSVADGFQLWAKRFDRPEKEALVVSDDVANAIALALTLERKAPARQAPTDARALDLYLRARHAARRGWRDDIDAALALFQQSLALAPDDPTILAGYARAELRRFMFDTEGTAAVDAEAKGRAAAERALALAPQLGDARAALANLKWVMGDSLGSARDLREAIRVAPSSTDVAELYGRMLLEAGAPERALAILGAAASLDPTIDLATNDLLRGRVLLGDWSGYESALQEPPADDVELSAYYLTLTRLAMWRRDGAGAQMLHGQVEARSFGLRDSVLDMLAMVQRGAPTPRMYEVLGVWGRVVGRARRRPTFMRQLAAEARAFAREDAACVAAMAEGDALGLLDLTWVDRCPLFDGMREGPAFVEVRGRIAARAKAALDVLEGRVD
jgi:TolB-like protein